MKSAGSGTSLGCAQLIDRYCQPGYAWPRGTRLPAFVDGLSGTCCGSRGASLHNRPCSCSPYARCFESAPPPATTYPSLLQRETIIGQENDQEGNQEKGNQEQDSLQVSGRRHDQEEQDVCALVEDQDQEQDQDSLSIEEEDDAEEEAHHVKEEGHHKEACRQEGDQEAEQQDDDDDQVIVGSQYRCKEARCQARFIGRIENLEEAVFVEEGFDGAIEGSCQSRVSGRGGDEPGRTGSACSQDEEARPQLLPQTPAASTG